MVYAADILSNSFTKTKELLFPIRKNYWLKMAFVSLFKGNNLYTQNTPNLNQSTNSSQNITFKEAIAKINTESLDLLSKYGYVIGAIFFIFYLIILFFTYLNSMFTFVFLDGIIKKEIKIKNAIKETKTQAISLFFFRVILGFFNLIIVSLIFSPLIISFFNNTLSDFKLINLIPLIVVFVIYSIFLEIFLFLVHDFIIPLMYLKKLTFAQAFFTFKKLAKNQKLEIFIYSLLKIILMFGSFFLSLFILLFILILAGFLFLIGLLLYFLLKFNMILALIILIIYALISIIFIIYAFSVLSLPISIFFEVYKIDMVNALEKGSSKKEKLLKK